MNQFAGIYERNDWGYGSGVGSLPLNNIDYMRFVQNFMKSNNVRSIVDLGCGDWQFSRFIDWSLVQYTGLDIVEEVVKVNQQRHSAPNIQFKLLETVEAVPTADLLLCKDVLQHLSNDTVRSHVGVLKTKFRFLLITNDVWPTEPNRDIKDGEWRPVRLDLPPFSEVAPAVLSWTLSWGGWKPTTKSVALLVGGP